ncbi:MAG: sulfotransferase [Gemmatimonadota bacterium]
MRSIVFVGRALDHIFFPGFRRQQIARPVYIVGSPRSGTTFLHSLLALDEERFTSLKLYETLFPSIVICRTIEAAAGLDRLIGRPIGKLTAWVETRAFGGWDDVHGTAFARHEEPEGTWVLKMATPAVYLLFPFFDEMPELESLELLHSERARCSAIRFYLGTLRRHLYLDARRGVERTLLVKTVLFPSRIEAVMEALPDIRFVYLMRDPRRTVASALSMLTMPWKVHSPGIVGSTPETARFADVFIEGYRKYLRARAETPPERWLTIDFADMTGDPDDAVRRIYDYLDLDLDDHLAERLRVAARTADNRRSMHRYTLEQFGLTAGDIERALPEVVAEAVAAPPAPSP